MSFFKLIGIGKRLTPGNSTSLQHKERLCRRILLCQYLADVVRHRASPHQRRQREVVGEDGHGKAERVDAQLTAAEANESAHLVQQERDAELDEGLAQVLTVQISVFNTKTAKLKITGA